MEAPITITQRELLSLLPKVQSQVRDNVTTCRIPKEVVSTHSGFQDKDYNKKAIFHLAQAPIPITLFRIHGSHHQMPPDRSTIVDDPIEQYYWSLCKEPDPEHLRVGTTSSTVHSILTLIDNNQKEEYILDPGCQIVAIVKNYLP